MSIYLKYWYSMELLITSKLMHGNKIKELSCLRIWGTNYKGSRYCYWRKAGSDYFNRDPAEILSHSAKLGLKNISGATIINPISHAKKDHYIDMMVEIRKSKGMTKEESIETDWRSSLSWCPHDQNEMLMWGFRCRSCYRRCIKTSFPLC